MENALNASNIIRQAGMSPIVKGSQKQRNKAKDSEIPS
jgi:hypothetical protein